ncbi:MULTISPECIES: MxaH protein [unclassified Methylobacterium]|uniref:MxaH protein n=1 Tax=unclassified Methylobacterium TaxID=2615210 RepID=UPI0011C1F466|nr:MULTISPECIES: MxaH protein [unclassified Methylobacterium]QEE41730.1 MxaH protein [Methylobacterium sp. WL1]TXN56210.1 MxaH protein [Methylobacterium sp. WL2]
MRRGLASLVAASLVVAGLVLAACDRAQESGSEEGQAVVARTAESELPPWLSPTDGTDPARWLAGREAGHPVPAGSEPVRVLQDALAEARTAFIEDPRMIANRTAQLGQMLAEIGKTERYALLLTGFSAVAARRGRHKSLYGEMCQHYFNTRARGVDHAAALALLADRFAPGLNSGAAP